MGKLYFKKPLKEENLNQLKPGKETIKFLLNYSRTLKVIEYKNMKFDLLLN